MQENAVPGWGFAQLQPWVLLLLSWLGMKSEQGWGWRCQGCLCQTSVSWGHHFVREGRTSIAGGESEGSSTFYL